MPEVPIEKRFAILSTITRAQHFAWREATAGLAPDLDPVDAVIRMWEVTGRDTGRAYVARMDADKPIAPQFARSIAWSSQCMGEDAEAEVPAPEGGRDEAWVRHTDCPWFHWHKKLDLLAEDQPGCDAWFRATIDEINRTLGTSLRFETLESLPEGGSCCLRRLWTEAPPPGTSP